MNKATKKFVENNGFICNNCAKVVVDGTKHKNEEDICDQCKIADLEAKLKETEKELEIVCVEGKDKIRELIELNSELQQKDEQLKQQLAEKEKKLENYKLCRCLDCKNETQYMLERNIENLEREIEKQEQDKILFVVDKLKKLKDRLSSMQWCFAGRRNFLQEVEIMRKLQEEMIDEEIEDLLKEMK